MDKTLFAIRLVFIALCAWGGWLVTLTILAGDSRRWWAVVGGFFIGALVVLVDIMLKGFSLRGLSALTFGIGVGVLIAHFISISPLLDQGDPQTVYLVRVSLFIVCPYLATVIALRGK